MSEVAAAINSNNNFENEMSKPEGNTDTI